jgi:hypothetical protein
MSAIYRERIRAMSQPKIEARQRRQQKVQAARAAKRMTKTVTAIRRRTTGTGEPQAPSGAFSQVLNLFRAEYESLSEDEACEFESVVNRYLAGRLSVDEWTRFSRSVRAAYKARLPLEPKPGTRSVKAKDRWVPPPQGW